ncbi:Cone cGMP-specific 3',5'-cyclic phosphodiesterase subunit alpha' [Labeo rohita]|uniref:Cone cGMP-specific 3',5'-cyclic phosphodiesterase subunit alpha n=1 Tax=Labeo rohita TaxID=84645 RepID=A0ABQ8MXB2_LABRO|nr:Cone cGMP-specific 3',5'-cyclic phosphodiesterase subunit alpha' [Labeo rohita]
MVCVFYDGTLNTAYRPPLSKDGPREDFATFVEWTLHVSSTLDPVPSPPSPHCTQHMPEPTADGEAEPQRTSHHSME